ncbi:MAG: CHAP domain-containing protein [Deltaproteobacteria bacterium]|nr:CHAP domain-containing protein [Deltaproteobacteria bacterium]
MIGTRTPRLFGLIPLLAIGCAPDPGQQSQSALLDDDVVDYVPTDRSVEIRAAPAQLDVMEAPPDILAIAEAEEGKTLDQVGVSTGYPLSTYAGAAAGGWCSEFVAWAYWRAGCPFTEQRGTYPWMIGGSTQIRQWFVTNSRFVYQTSAEWASYEPQPGDYVRYNNPQGGHSGIVRYAEGTTLYTVEGNVNNKVMLRTLRNYKTAYADPTDGIDGFGVMTDDQCGATTGTGGTAGTGGGAGTGGTAGTGSAGTGGEAGSAGSGGGAGTGGTTGAARNGGRVGAGGAAGSSGTGGRGARGGAGGAVGSGGGTGRGGSGGVAEAGGSSGTGGAAGGGAGATGMAGAAGAASSAGAGGGAGRGGAGGGAGARGGAGGLADRGGSIGTGGAAGVSSSGGAAGGAAGSGGTPSGISSATGAGGNSSATVPASDSGCSCSTGRGRGAGWLVGFAFLLLALLRPATHEGTLRSRARNRGAAGVTRGSVDRAGWPAAGSTGRR